MMRSVLVLAVALGTSAAAFAGGKRVLLVQLHGEKNRLDAARKMNRADLAAKIGNDAAQARRYTILDFSTFFNACPVYYFVDSNLDKIKAGQYDGLLLNADGTAASAPEELKSGNFMVTTYAVPTDKKMIEPGAYRRRNAMILYDNKFKQVDFFYRSSTVSLPRSERAKYYYESKEYEIEYFPMARTINEYFKENR